MLPGPIDERMDLNGIRQTLIFGALREAGFYLQTATLNGVGDLMIEGHRIDHDLVRTVAVDEAVTRFMGREMFADAAQAATEALRYVETAGIERLLREKGYLP